MEVPKPIKSLQYEAMRRTLVLPPRVSARMFGAPPVNDRGTALDTQAHTLLSLIKATKQPELHTLTVRKAREVYDEATQTMDIKAPWEVKTYHGFVPGKRPVPYEVYRPHHVKSRNAPGILFFHGGGFVIGSAKGHAAIAKYIAHQTDSVVFNVDYSLAPENPFPCGIEDCIAAFNHVVNQHHSFGVDPKRLMVLGDSAGATLSINVSQAQVEAGRQAPYKQILFFPTTDAGPYASRELFGEGFFLSHELINWFSNTYLGASKFEIANDPRALPRRFKRKSELPSTYIVTCGFDPLRDEGEAYVKDLDEAGVEVHHHDAKDIIHGFITMGGVLNSAKTYIDRALEHATSDL